MLPFFTPRPRSPFADKPTTWTLKDRKGKVRGYRIEAGFLTPLRARIADALAVGSTGLLTLCAFDVGMTHMPGDAGLAIVACLCVVLAHPVTRFVHRRALRTSTLVEITRDTFRVNSLLGWRTYDRNLPHRFSILQHDKALAEREAHDLKDREEAARTGKVVRRTKYHQDSWHVVFEYNLQRIDLADVCGIKDARAFQARLSGCAQMMDALAGEVSGLVAEPADQWAKAPGAIPR